MTGTHHAHTYPTPNAVVALATVVDSAGARSSTIQVRIAGARLRAKQVAGNRLTGVLADQDTGNGVPSQQVDAYRCASRSTPLAQCERIGTGATRADGSYRIRIPEVTKKFVALVAYAGTASKSATDPARFGARGAPHRPPPARRHPARLGQDRPPRRDGPAQRQGRAGQEGQDRPPPGLPARQVALDRQGDDLAGQVRRAVRRPRPQAGQGQGPRPDPRHRRDVGGDQSGEGDPLQPLGLAGRAGRAPGRARSRPGDTHAVSTRSAVGRPPGSTTETRSLVEPGEPPGEPVSDPVTLSGLDALGRGRPPGSTTETRSLVEPGEPPGEPVSRPRESRETAFGLDSETAGRLAR